MRCLCGERARQIQFGRKRGGSGRVFAEIRKRTDESCGPCLVRMSETMADPLILATDSEFHVYRRHSRQWFLYCTPDDTARLNSVPIQPAV